MKSRSYKTIALMLVLVSFSLTVPLAFSQSIRPDAAKMDGTTRVGLVTPRVTLIGGGGSVLQETSSLQKTIVSYLSGPRIGTISIKAKLDALALEEARDRECDFVVFISLTRKRNAPKGASSGFGSGTKAGDEFTFEYKVQSTDGGPAKSNTLNGRVTADGEDVVTPMIESMAQVVVELARTLRPVQSTASTSGSASPAPPTETKTDPGPTTPKTNSSPSGYGSLTAPPRTSTSNDPPKVPGTIRIGLAIPRVIGGGMNTGSGDAAALRKTIISYFEGSNIETIELKARLDGLVMNEAQKRDCDFVLFTTLTRKRKTSSGGGGLSGILGNVGMGNKVPGTKTASQIGSETARVSGAIASLAKANDEITLEYKLTTSVGNRSVAEKTTSAKVKADGEDVLTPMIENAAQAIINATVKN